MITFFNGSSVLRTRISSEHRHIEELLNELSSNTDPTVIASSLAAKIQNFCQLNRDYRRLKGDHTQSFEDLILVQVEIFLKKYHLTSLSRCAAINELRTNIQNTCSKIAGYDSDIKTDMVTYNNFFCDRLFLIMTHKLEEALKPQDYSYSSL